MTLLGHWKFAGQPQTNLVADQAGSMDITHGGGNGSGWWRDAPDYAISGDSSSWAFTPDLASRPDPTSHTDLSFCFAIKALPSPRTATSIFFFYGSSAGGYKGWGIALNMSNGGSIQCIDSAALWNGTSWQTFPNTGNVFPSVADQRSRYYGVSVNITQGGNTEAFINGQSLGTVTTGTFQHDTTAATQKWGQDYSYIDNIQYHDRLLTASEIQAQAYFPRTWVEGTTVATGLGDEQLWLSATNDNTGTSTAFQDQSGNGNNGTASGTLVVADTSEGGTYAFTMDGNDAITTTTGIGSASETSWSASYWFYTAASASANVMNGTATTGPYSYWHSNAEGRYGSRPTILYGGSGAGVITAWTHVAIVVDGGSAELFINGVSDVSGTTDATCDFSSTLRFGSYFNTVAGINGAIDDIRIYLRTLTQAEIVHLAEARGIEGPPPVGLGDEKLWLCPSINDSANDISGNGNDGTYNGGMATVADTGSGGTRAYDFDGTDDYISFASVVTSQTFSASLWFNADVLAAQDMLIGNNDYDAGQRGWNITSEAQPVFATYQFAGSSGSKTSLTSTQSTSLSTWTHIAVSYDDVSKQMSIYVNGVSGGTTTVTGLATLLANLTIGKTTIQWFNGKQDDIRIYDRVLTQAEITHLATSRGIEGGPSTPSAQYNAFITHAFKQLFQTRLR